MLDSAHHCASGRCFGGVVQAYALVMSNGGAIDVPGVRNLQRRDDCAEIPAKRLNCAHMADVLVPAPVAPLVVKIIGPARCERFDFTPIPNECTDRRAKVLEVALIGGG